MRGVRWFVPSLTGLWSRRAVALAVSVLLRE
jgi:hypothetical protein